MVENMLNFIIKKRIMELTKEQFAEYRKCQDIGLFNMLDWESWRYGTTLTEKQWWEAIKNYKYYKQKYKI